MPPNSLPAPSLHEKSLYVANELCSGRKKQKKSTQPTPTDQQATVSSLHKKPINQAALNIRNGSKTTPGFNMRRADSNFHLWW